MNEGFSRCPSEADRAYRQAGTALLRRKEYQIVPPLKKGDEGGFEKVVHDVRKYL
ncbi:MAG: hypothetical protein ABH836_01950 [Candidatus Omnitrophota bacterium]